MVLKKTARTALLLSLSPATVALALSSSPWVLLRLL
jgi:hypothetical protein